MDRVSLRCIALQNARDRAQDTDFKLLWELKLQQLIKLAERGEKGQWANTKTK
tara:strand:+ start:1601 stop:1759 length:159 start_codon:yes stop_codon:yes gene_type:complete